MTTTTILKPKKNLSHINNLKDLQQEKRMVKARIERTETELEERWKQLPAESFKTIVRHAVPFYLNNKVLDKSWGLVSTVANFLRHKDGQTSLKKGLLNNAKKLGLFTAIKTAYNFWQKKK